MCIFYLNTQSSPLLRTYHTCKAALDITYNCVYIHGLIDTGMVSAIDGAVKTIVDAFKENGLWDNTVTIFSSGRQDPKCPPRFPHPRKARIPNIADKFLF